MAEIETAARLLARSGKFLNYRGVNSQLAELGYPEAGKLFANRWTQTEIDRICREAWSVGSNRTFSFSDRDLPTDSQQVNAFSEAPVPNAQLDPAY